MWTTAECYAPNATADEATDDTEKAEHATTRKTKTNETDYPSQSCQLGTPTHGETHTAIQHRRKAGEEERREVQKKRREDKTTRKTQWCSGITCVLAELRAHYPEHQQQEEEEEKERGEDDEQ